MGDDKVNGEKFYSIYISPEDQEKSNDVSTVVVGFKAACEILKRNPKARFRCASSEAEGWSYLEDETEARPLSSDTDDILVNRVNKTEEDGESQDSYAVQKRRKGRLSLPAMNSQPPKVNMSAPSKDAEEKDNRFPTPKVQELTGMAAAVRQKRNDAVIKQMEANPKLLVNDCDFPPTVQHGCHYNILHVAALANNYEIISYVLNKVGSRKFMMELYPKKNEEEIDRLIKFVTDGYLNTPDKIANETPLHCAAKFLGSESVAILLSHPWCKLDIVNAYSETPVKVIGSRAAAPDPGKVARMKSFFENWYIVPIWRDSFGCSLPEIGPIAHVRDLKACTPPSLMKNFPDFNVNLLGPCEQSLAPKTQEIGQLPFENSSWKIEAYAGPTSKAQAEELLAAIRCGGNCGIESPSIMSPRTSEYSILSTPVSSSNDRAFHNSKRNLFHSTPRRRKPSEGSRLRQSFATPPSSPLRNGGSFITSPPALELSYHRRTDIEKGLERHARQIAMDYNVPWVEHWKCLHFFGDIRLDEGLSNLEQFLKSKESEMNLVLNSSIDSNNEDNNNLSLEEWSESKDEDFAKKYSVYEPESDDDSEASFYSAKSNESNEQLFVDCRDKVLFIDGERPGKSDRQVYAVLKEYDNEIDADKYPLVFQWLNTIQLGLGLGNGNVAEEHKSGLHDMSDLAASFFNLRID